MLQTAVIPMAVGLAPSQAQACVTPPLFCVPAGNVVAELQAERGSVIVVDEDLQDVGGRLRVIECNSGQALFVTRPAEGRAGPYEDTRRVMVGAVFDSVPRTMRDLAAEIGASTGLEARLETGVQHCLCDGRRQTDAGDVCD